MPAGTSVYEPLVLPRKLPISSSVSFADTARRDQKFLAVTGLFTPCTSLALRLKHYRPHKIIRTPIPTLYTAELLPYNVAD